MAELTRTAPLGRASRPRPSMARRPTAAPAPVGQEGPAALLRALRRGLRGHRRQRRAPGPAAPPETPLQHRW